MRLLPFVGASATLLLISFTPALVHGQSTSGMDHSAHVAMGKTSTSTPAGQDAYATVAAVVAALEADSTTDWSKVNIEALRQHLLVMNDVTLGARATQSPIAGGARMDVTGDGRVAQSIRTMLRAHASELEKMGVYRTTVEDIPSGVRLTVTASDASDTATVAKIRGLGFMGLLTLGDHHAQHHMALARGMTMTHR